MKQNIVAFIKERTLPKKASGTTATGTGTVESTAPVLNHSGVAKVAPIFNDDKLRVQFVNQYDVPINYTDPVLHDRLGEVVPGSFDLEETTSFHAEHPGLYTFSEKVSAGTYTVAWQDSVASRQSDIWGFPSVQRQIQGGEAGITVPDQGNRFVFITVNQTNISYWNGGGDVYVQVKNEAGTPLHDVECKLANTRWKDIECELLHDDNGKYEVHAAVVENNHYISNAGLEANLPGSYTLTLSKSGYKSKTITYTLPDVSTWSDDEITAKRPGVINLGVILEKE